MDSESEYLFLIYNFMGSLYPDDTLICAGSDEVLINKDNMDQVFVADMIMKVSPQRLAELENDPTVTNTELRSSGSIETCVQYMYYDIMRLVNGQSAE